MRILVLFLIVSGFLVVTYFSGPKNTPQQAPALTYEAQSSPVVSPSPVITNPTIAIRNKTTGEVKQIPESQKTNFVPTPQSKNVSNTSSPTPAFTPNPYEIKPSNMSSALAVIVYSNLGNEKTKYIRQFANGSDDLNLAIHNFALMLDKNPNIAASLMVYIMNKNSQRSSNTTIEDLEDKIDTLNNKIEDLNDNLGY